MIHCIARLAETLLLAGPTTALLLHCIARLAETTLLAGPTTFQLLRLTLLEGTTLRCSLPCLILPGLGCGHAFLVALVFSTYPTTSFQTNIFFHRGCKKQRGIKTETLRLSLSGSIPLSITFTGVWRLHKAMTDEA